jgi:hypothetical protein
MDLSSMCQNLGPAGGAIVSGMQMADAANEQKSMEAYRKAQMDEIMQKTAQQAEMHPLELQSKQQLIEKGTQDLEKGKVDLEKSKYDLTVGKLEGAVKKVDAYTQLLNAAALQLQNIPVKAPGDPTRHNFLAKFATDNGIDLKDPAIQGLIQQTSAIPADKLPETILDFSNKLALSKPNIVAKIAEIKQQGKNQIEVARIGAAARENAAAAKNQPGMGFKEFNKLQPKVRISVITKALADGIDPVTGSELKEDQRAGYAEMLQKDTDTLNAELASRQQQGVVPQVENGKVKLINKSQAQVGKTKSGVAYTVLPPQ